MAAKEHYQDGAPVPLYTSLKEAKQALENIKWADEYPGGIRIVSDREIVIGENTYSLTVSTGLDAKGLALYVFDEGKRDTSVTAIATCDDRFWGTYTFERNDGAETDDSGITLPESAQELVRTRIYFKIN